MGAVLDLGLERLGSDHRLLKVRSVDREREVGHRGKKTRQVRKGGILELDNELLTVVGRDQVHCERHPLRFAAAHPNAEEVENELRAHRPDHDVPLVAMSRVGRWSRTKTLGVTAACGLGHRVRSSSAP